MKFKKFNHGAFVTILLLKIVMVVGVVAFAIRLAESFGV